MSSTAPKEKTKDSKEKPKEKDKRPTLAGQRIRSRKRDEKVKYEPEVFRAEILKGLVEAQNDFEKASKFLDVSGGTLDYHRYADCLFDIVVSGGLLAPGGEVSGPICPLSLFELPDAQESIQSIAQLFQKLIRRYKYMQVSLEEEISKMLKFIKTFTAENRSKLAKLTAALFGMGLVSVKALESLQNDISVKEGLSLDFIAILFRAWLGSVEPPTSMASIAVALRKEKIDLLDFCPANKRTPEALRAFLTEAGGLEDVIAWQATQQTKDSGRQLQKDILGALHEAVPPVEIVKRIKEDMAKNNLSDVDVIERCFSGVMESVEWSKKPDIVSEQALKLVKSMVPLFAPFASTEVAQLALMVRMQNFCSDNPLFLKLFSKFALLLYKDDVLSEEAILEWYERSPSPKGRTTLVEQMQELVDWLRNAEEESSEEDDS